jgi:hypothetical protein
MAEPNKMQLRIVTAIRRIPRGKVSTYRAGQDIRERLDKLSGFYIVRSDYHGIAFWAPVAKLSCAAIPPSNSGCVWKPKVCASEADGLI